MSKFLLMFIIIKLQLQYVITYVFKIDYYHDNSYIPTNVNLSNFKALSNNIIICEDLAYLSVKTSKESSSEFSFCNQQNDKDYKILISSATHDSLIYNGNSECQDKKRAHSLYYTIEYSSKFIENSTCINTFEICNFIYNYSQIKIDGILSLKESFKKSSLNSTFAFRNLLNKTEYQNIIINNMNQSLLVGQNLSSPYNYSKCEQFNKVPFSCKLDYIILGNEIDIYLAKKLNESLIFDSLSYYSILPLEKMNYFFKEFFNLKDLCSIDTFPKNEKDSFYYIKCPKSQIDIQTKNRPIHFIINGYSYEYRDLFSPNFYFNKSDSSLTEEIYFFNIIFRENQTEWILGSKFMLNKSIGYDYEDETVLLYQENRKELFQYYPDPVQNNNKKGVLKSPIFYIANSAFIILISVLFIVYCRSQGKLERELN